MPVNLSSLFSTVNEVSPVNNKEAQSAENAGNTSGAQNISGTIQKTADEAGIAMLKNMLKGDTFSGQIINVSDGNALLQLTNGSLINAKLAEILDLKVGDQLTLSLDNKDYKVKIAGIYKLYFRHYIYMSPKYYENLTKDEVHYNSQYFKLNKKASEKKLTNYCDHHENITSIQYVSGISEGFYSQMESLDSVVFILIVCAGALAFIVLYNLTNINIQERKSEIATIKVLGFYPKEVYDYVFRENIILAFIGSIVGLGLGKIIHAYLIRTVEVDMAMFIRTVNIRCYMIAIILTMAFTFLINLYMRRVLKKIDMVESLKSIE